MFSNKLNYFNYCDEQVAEIIFKFEVLDSGSNRKIFGGKILKKIIPYCFYAPSEPELAL